jgi:hypothetical protein
MIPSSHLFIINFSLDISLIAYEVEDFLCVASHTFPKVPLPIIE